MVVGCIYVVVCFEGTFAGESVGNFGFDGGGRLIVFKFRAPNGAGAGELDCCSDFRGDVANGDRIEGSRMMLCFDEVLLEGPKAWNKAASTSWCWL